VNFKNSIFYNIRNVKVSKFVFKCIMAYDCFTMGAEATKMLGLS